MSKLYWQLPWAGPRIDGDRFGWAVMPDPALGNAMGACIPVSLDDGKVVLRLANPDAAIPISEVRLGVWTTLTPQPGVGKVRHLCLLGYDQAEGGFGYECVVHGGSTVVYADLQSAVLELQRIRGDEVTQQLVSWPDHDCCTNQPAAEAGPEAEVSMALAFGSCQYPSGLMDGGLAEASYLQLAARLGQPEPPTHLLLLGDQVYVDATAGLLDPTRLDDRYRMPYEQLLRIEPLRRIMRLIPVFGMLDDHEIADNWEPFRTGAGGSLHDRGVAAYWTFQRMRPPAPLGPMPPLWYTVGGLGWSAFMANTRTTRDWRSAGTLGEADILGKVQKKALEEWLLALPPDHLKLIASPAMVLPRLLEHMDDPLYLDNWQGYPASLQGLLAFLCEHQIANVCFLSGDAHLAADARITVRRDDKPVSRMRSLHAPALYAPLPFANERLYNLKVPRDRFQFDHEGHTYFCSVAGKVLQLPHRDGSWVLNANRKGRARWKISAKLTDQLS
jgi:hypothetical protein